jgi:prepilin-type N-terminal cleavage/methylation domain-containing protein
MQMLIGNEALKINMKNKNYNQLGFTLIEVLIGLFVLAVAVLTLYALFQMSLKALWESKAKITATQLANQKMEMAHNLPYAAVGVVGGIPNGVIPATENINRNDINFTVNTSVVYIDDSFDGLQGGVPDDILPIDYKRVRVEVVWSSTYGQKSLVYLSDISAKEIESVAGGGTLKILVLNASGQPVPQAQVHIVNTAVNPIINLTMETNDNGLLILPGSPAATNNYEITVTKNDGGVQYSTDQTYAATTENPMPEKRHASVFEGQQTSISFAIDELATLNANVENASGIGLAYVNFNLRGDKLIGHDEFGNPIYKYEETKTTDANGRIHLTTMEWDSYTFSLPAVGHYNIAETLPLQPFDLLPASTTDFNIILEPKDQFSVLVVAKDINGNPLGDVTVRLFDKNLTRDETATTTDAGQFFFTPWGNASTTIQATKAGFENYEDFFDVNGYHIENIIMVTP